MLGKKGNSTKRCKVSGEKGGFGLPLSAGSSMVGEARPREGMLGARTEPGRAIQGCSALCRPVERQRATGVLPRCRRAWDTQHVAGEEAPQHSLHVPNMGSIGDLRRFCGPGGAPGETVAPRQLQDTDVQLRHWPRGCSRSRNITLTQNC